MVGAKQFAIMRKIIEDKKKNPIVKNIAMPPWMRGEKELTSLSGSFLDKFNFNSKKTESLDKTTLKPKTKPITEVKNDNIEKSSTQEKVNPIVQNISAPLSVMKSNDIRKFSEGLFDKFTSLSKIITKSQKPVEPQITKEEDKKEISEEVLNKLTYDVFQNIKSYLEYHPINKPATPERSKHIKLEISL